MLAIVVREKVKEFLTPLGKRLAFVEPNHITFLSIIIVFFASLSIYYQNFVAAFLLVVLSSFLDVLDGLVAKTNKKTTLIGNYFDAMIDRIHEFLIMLAFAFSGYAIQAFLAFSSSLLVSYAKARAEMIKPLNNIDWPSIGERAERLLVLIIMIFIRIFTDNIEGYDVISAFLMFIFIMTLLGFFQRMVFALRYLGDKN